MAEHPTVHIQLIYGSNLRVIEVALEAKVSVLRSLLLISWYEVHSLTTQLGSFNALTVFVMSHNNFSTWEIQIKISVSMFFLCYYIWLKDTLWVVEQCCYELCSTSKNTHCLNKQHCGCILKWHCHSTFFNLAVVFLVMLCWNKGCLWTRHRGKLAEMFQKSTSAFWQHCLH